MSIGPLLKIESQKPLPVVACNGLSLSRDGFCECLVYDYYLDVDLQIKPVFLLVIKMVNMEFCFGKEQDLGMGLTMKTG